MKKTLLSLAIASLAAGQSVCAAVEKVYNEPDSVYIFSYAHPEDEGRSGLKFAWSPDGDKWLSVSDGFAYLKCDFGRWGAEKRMIKPLLEKAEDGRWYCRWQLTPSGKVWGTSHSSDLLKWAPQQYVNAEKPAVPRLVTARQIVLDKDTLNGYMQKVPYADIEQLIRFAEHKKFRDIQNNERTEQDAVRFAGLKPVAATIRVDTYSGSTKIGTASKNFTLNVPASVKPTIESFTAERIDGAVPSDWGIYVKGKSKAKLTISGAAAGGHGATLKSYSITGGGYTGSTAEYTTGFLNTAGTIPFTAKVTDSRGRTASKTVSVTVEDYAPPVIQSASAARCDASGSLQDDGAYVLVTHSLTYSSLGGKNSLSRSYRFRRVRETSWQNAQYMETESGDIVGAGDISPDYSYEIELKAEDELENVSRILPVSTAKVIMDWKKGGAGMAIGKVSEKDGLEVAWPVIFHQSLQINPEANGSYGMDVFRANDEGKTGSDLSFLVGLSQFFRNSRFFSESILRTRRNKDLL